MIERLADRIKNIDDESIPFILALASMKKSAKAFSDNDPSSYGLVAAALRLLGVPSDSKSIIRSAQTYLVYSSTSRIQPVELIASGLLNTLNYAKEENDLGRRDALLDELRTLRCTCRSTIPLSGKFWQGAFLTRCIMPKYQTLRAREPLFRFSHPLPELCAHRDVRLCGLIMHCKKSQLATTWAGWLYPHYCQGPSSVQFFS